MNRRLLAIPALSLLLVATWLVYSPGLSGGFLFDDLVNLDKLNSPGPVNNWPAFWRYVTSGTADPIGRPLSVLTFLLDARQWPADPAPFLRTNLLLHLCNGVLLFALLRLLGTKQDEHSRRANTAALLGTGFWLLHPLFVSTTLYVVQREAMLPATFTLLGLLSYVHGRRLHASRPWAGIAWMVGGIGAGTLLAILSKANGALLPVFAWVLEATVLRDPAGPLPQRDHRLVWLRRMLLVAPSLLIFGYLLSFLPSLHAPLEHRTWTIAERLLTQPRVLLDYLQLLAVPRVLSTGLYNDGYTASTALLQPGDTLPSLLAVVSLVALGFALRRRAPVAAAALLFFFAGHLLESTTIPLELYFEHRNYLPAMLLFWPLARMLCTGSRHRSLRGATAVVLLAACAAITWQRADLWGKPEQMARLWALQNPASSRAQATAASFDVRSGRPEMALQRLAPLLEERPHDLQIALNYANAACGVRGLSPADIEVVAAAMRNADEGYFLVFRWLDRALGVAENARCPGLGFTEVERWLAAAWENPRMRSLPGRRQDLHSLAGRMALHRGNPALALARFNDALAAYPTPSAAAMQAAILASNGHYASALAHLNRYEQLAHRVPDASWGMPRAHQQVLDAQDYWPRELGLLRKKLRDEIAAQRPAQEAEELGA